mgnify:FL=1
MFEKFTEYLCYRSIATVDSQNVHVLLRETLKCVWYFIGVLRDEMVDIRVICDNSLHGPQLGAVAAAVGVADQADVGWFLDWVVGIQRSDAGLLAGFARHPKSMWINQQICAQEICLR